MSGAIVFLAIVYILVMVSVLGIMLYLGFRFVRAFEKISDAYDRKNK